MVTWLMPTVLTLGLSGFLLLALLGVMRETVTLRGEVTALTQLITTPPAPAYLHNMLPPVIAQALGHPDRRRLILFVSPQCGACNELLQQLQDSRSDLLPEDRIALSIVVGGHDIPAPLLRVAKELTPDMVHDADGSLYRAAAIIGTPTSLYVNRAGIVTAYRFGADARWIRDVTASEVEVGVASTASGRD
jgi:hypothetical protein